MVNMAPEILERKKNHLNEIIKVIICLFLCIFIEIFKITQTASKISWTLTFQVLF